MLTKTQILDHVWDYDFGGDTNVVESYVSVAAPQDRHHRAPAAPHHPQRRLRAAPPVVLAELATRRAGRAAADNPGRRPGRTPLRVKMITVLLARPAVAPAVISDAILTFRNYLIGPGRRQADGPGRPAAPISPARHAQRRPDSGRLPAPSFSGGKPRQAEQLPRLPAAGTTRSATRRPRRFKQPIGAWHRATSAATIGEMQGRRFTVASARNHRPHRTADRQAAAAFATRAISTAPPPAGADRVLVGAS